MKLWLDDERPAPDGWYWEKNPINALARILRGGITELSLDHDLACFEPNGEVTGYHILKVLEELAYIVGLDDIPEKISIHSANPVGRKNMQAAIDSIERMRNGLD